MENKCWIDILVEKMKLDSEYEIKKINDEWSFYLVEGINLENSQDEMLLVYDCSKMIESDTFHYIEMKEAIDKHNESYPVIVFRNWEHERCVYWKYYETLSMVEKKSFTAWYDKKISIYVEEKTTVTLETDDKGINYLEYPVKKINYPVNLQGRVYNISFYELKKLYNVRGSSLFEKNVRYGLRSNSAGNNLKLKFREYLSIAVYKKIIELNLAPDLLETLKDVLVVEDEFNKFLDNIIENKEQVEYDWSYFLPENFWFFHNGISIYSYEKELQRPANQIILSPDKAHVINGAQTLTNFFLEVEFIERLLKPIIVAENVSVKGIMDSIIKEIYVKTVIINGDDKVVRPITHGLNTQIPILGESLMADSKTSEEINKILEKCSSASNRIRILKDGEIWRGDGGINVLDFVKNWLTINNQPGKSKNFPKSQLKKMMKEIAEQLKNDTSSIKKMEMLFQIYNWWDAAKMFRLNEKRDKESLDIGKYGKNYFGSYILNLLDDLKEEHYLDDDHFIIWYESFLKDIKLAVVDIGSSINLGIFKKDELSARLFTIQKEQQENKQQKVEYPINIEEDIKNLLNKDGQNVYSFSKTIADYLIEKGIVLDYFRVISRTDDKCKESFPFPNSTFIEIVDSFEIDKDSVKKIKDIVYDNSVFEKAINKTFPVFVVDKNDKEKKNKVSKVHLIKDFSFNKFSEEASIVYGHTIDAFEKGDESLFPRSGGNMFFHIRPKAINAEDTFQFTNGNYITKRTFWANKNTVEAIIKDKLGNS